MIITYKAIRTYSRAQIEAYIFIYKKFKFYALVKSSSNKSIIFYDYTIIYKKNHQALSSLIVIVIVSCLFINKDDETKLSKFLIKIYRLTIVSFWSSDNVERFSPSADETFRWKLLTNELLNDLNAILLRTCSVIKSTYNKRKKCLLWFYYASDYV